MISSLRSFYSSHQIRGLHAAFRQAGELQGAEGRSCQGKKNHKGKIDKLSFTHCKQFSEGNPAMHHPGEGRGPQALPPLPARASRPWPSKPSVPPKEYQLRK